MAVEWCSKGSRESRSEDSDEDGSDKSHWWDVGSITVEFQEAMDELERRGLEVRC